MANVPTRVRCGLPLRLAPLAILIGTLSACSPADRFLKAGDQLAMSGFTAHYANTTARYEMMNLLPAGVMTYRPTTSGPVYLYADRIGCGCVYMGSQSAFIDYTRHTLEPVPSQPAMTAEINQHPGWDWSVWSANADPGPNQPKHVIGAEW
ncbi:hypothetical protein AA0472_2903 [Acetobacter estunensis NRIC 0472]|uniref:hypothetical protein n=1 Tax=Acetobacter estunensis TaxID=104097 RepID=UPI001F54CC6B|nr:hypothetical protein [Acetobacter estunensis]GBQ29081.1 hypothetical protein AA0472_2903 [Acetobacter estunensis NRIC 0472]